MSVASNKPCSIESLAPKWRAEEIVTVKQHCMAANKRARRDWTMAEIHIDGASDGLPDLDSSESFTRINIWVPGKYLAFEQGPEELFCRNRKARLDRTQKRPWCTNECN